MQNENSILSQGRQSLGKKIINTVTKMKFIKLGQNVLSFLSNLKVLEIVLHRLLLTSLNFLQVLLWQHRSRRSRSRLAVLLGLGCWGCSLSRGLDKRPNRLCSTSFVQVLREGVEMEKQGAVGIATHGCPLSFARYVKRPESAAAENKVCTSWPARIVGISKTLRAKDAFETRVKENSLREEQTREGGRAQKSCAGTVHENPYKSWMPTLFCTLRKVSRVGRGREQSLHKLASEDCRHF